MSSLRWQHRSQGRSSSVRISRSVFITFFTVTSSWMFSPLEVFFFFSPPPPPQVQSKDQVIWSKLNTFKWAGRSSPEWHVIKLHAITFRLTGQDIGFLKFTVKSVWGEKMEKISLSHVCPPPPTTTVDVCSMWEKQTAILETSTGPIKKSWINLSLFKISNRAFIKNSLGPLCPSLVNTSLVLLWLMRAASEWAQCLCAWSLTLVSRTKSWTRLTSGLPQGVFPVSKTATFSKHILTAAYLHSVTFFFFLGLPHLKSAFIKITMFVLIARDASI